MVGFDAVIVGAGIVGSACATECARAGLRVAVIEADIPGGGATAAGMGHIVAMDDSEAQFALTRYSRELWNALANSLPDDVEYVRCGTIWVAADEDEMNEVRRKQSFYQARGARVELLDARSLAEAEPNLRAGLAGGLLVPDDGVIYPPCAARFLLKEAMRRGATLLGGKRAAKLHEDGVTLEDGSFVACGAAVNACGAMASKLTPECSIQPRKGHLLITDRYPGFLQHQLVELGYLKSAHSVTSDSVAFNVQPRRTGQVLIGSSRQYGNEDAAVDQRILGAMLRRAGEYMPGIGQLSGIRVWTGFRAATPDKLPLIGRCPGRKNVWLTTGHEGLGITTSLGTARLLVDQMLGRASGISPEPYLPERAFVAHG